MRDERAADHYPDAAATSSPGVDGARGAASPGAVTAATGAPDGPVDLELALEALRAVIDPEIGLDIVTLGLVYELESYEDGTLRVTHTLTTPGCPMEHVIGYGIDTVGMSVPGVTSVERNLVFEPRWHPGMIREGAL